MRASSPSFHDLRYADFNRLLAAKSLDDLW